MNKKISIILLSLLPFMMTIPLYFFGKMEFKYFVGELGYCLFIIEVLIGLRPYFLENVIELKKIYFWHGILAIIATVSAFLHVQLSHLDGIAELFGNCALYISIGTVIFGLIFLSHQFLDRIPMLKKILDVIRKISYNLNLKREFYYFLHIFSPLIVILIFLHVVCIPEFNSNQLFMIWFIGYFIIFTIMYLIYGMYKKLSPSKYEVISIKKENDQVFSLMIKYKKGKHLNIQGGQFLFIKAPFSKFNEYHPFSVLNADETVVTFGIKKCGDFTEKLSHIQPGSIIQVQGPYGHMLSKKAYHSVVAIAGGIGITPCISLLQDVSSEVSGTLIWSLHNKEELIFQDKINQLKESHPNIKVIYHYTSEQGHLTKESLEDYLVDINISTANYYLCGPKLMMDNMQEVLHSLQVKDKDIISEGFIF